jgi:hypothetical protein
MPWSLFVRGSAGRRRASQPDGHLLPRNHAARQDQGNPQTEQSYAMKTIRRTLVGASTLGLIARLLTDAFTQGAELPKCGRRKAGHHRRLRLPSKKRNAP